MSSMIANVVIGVAFLIGLSSYTYWGIFRPLKQAGRSLNQCRMQDQDTPACVQVEGKESNES